MARAIHSDALTPADTLRDLLTRCEARLVTIDAGGGVAELYTWMDEIAELWPEFAAAGVDLRAEQTRWQSLQSQVRNRGPKLLRAWHSQGGLRSARQAAAPDEDHWWWWLDEIVADARWRRIRRALLTLAVVVIAGGLLILVLNRLFPVDPNVKVVQRLQFEAEDALRAGDLPSARQRYEEAVALIPDDPDLHLMLGVVAEAQGDVTVAEQSWSQARALLGDEATFLTQRGRAYLTMNEGEKALDDELAALQLNPDMAMAYFFLGSAYELTGDLEAAVMAYSRAADLALEDDPQIVVLARTRMGTLLQQQGLPQVPGP